MTPVKILRALAAAFRRMNGVDWAQFHAKGAAATWAIFLVAYTPARVGASLGWVLVAALAGLVLIGALLSMAGLVMAARDDEKDPIALRRDLRRSLRGLGVELVGVILIIFGIALYFLTQAALTFGPDGDQRRALTVFAYFAGSMTVGRLASVLHRRRKERKLAASIGGTS